MTQAFLTLGRTLLASDVRTTSGQALLRSAKVLREHAICTCSTSAPKMAIKSLEGLLFPARFPGSGEHHDPCCPSYETPGAHIARQKMLHGLSAIIEHDGEVWVNLGVPLTQGNPSATSPVRHMGRGGGKRAAEVASTSLSAFMLYLLDRGGLTSQTPSAQPRHWSSGCKAIESTLPSIWVRGEPAHRMLLLPRYSNQRRIDQLLDEMRHGWTTYPKQHKLILGNVERVVELPGDRVSITLEYCSSQVHMHKSRWDAAIRFSSSSNAGNVVGSLKSPTRENQLLFLAVIEPAEANEVVAATAALAVTTPAYIPVASAPELTVANMLLDVVARIEKPVRARVECSPYVPDFVAEFTDCPLLFMEVAGRYDVKYLEHLVVKLLAYGAQGLSLWVWFVGLEALPPFTPQPLESVLDRADVAMRRARCRMDTRSKLLGKLE